MAPTYVPRSMPGRRRDALRAHASKSYGGTLSV